MSFKDTELTLINALVAEFTDVEILFENKKEIPAGTEFLEAFFIPVTNESTGKSIQDTQDNGIFQVTVAVKNDSYNNRALELIDRVAGAFGINTTLSYNGKSVYITEYSVNAGRESDGFYKRDMSINYLTFS